MLTVLTPGRSFPDALHDRLASFSPKTDLGRIVRSCFDYLPPHLAGELLDSITDCVVLRSRLSLVHVHHGVRRNYGVVSTKKITTVGVGFLVDAWQNSVELENMKYHGVGTGTNAESNADTALQTESTAILNPNDTRATGSTTEGASANIFRSVGTATFDGAGAITEHGILSQSATGGGVLWDRSVFSAVNVVSTDTIEFTYDMTASAEA
jgi:hypothetical protein